MSRDQVERIVRTTIEETGGWPAAKVIGIVRKIREEFGDEASKFGMDLFTVWMNTPEAQAKKRQMESEFEEEWKAKDRARLEVIEKRKQEWIFNYAYRWMESPVPVWDEEAEAIVPMIVIEHIAEVEAIRACAREWEAGNKGRNLAGHLLDHLGHFNMDWQNIVRRENGLRREFVDGIEFEEKNEAFNL
ncbi:MAG TPA: hypothetical protein VGK03_10370 [Geothrix sp.]